MTAAVEIPKVKIQPNNIKFFIIVTFNIYVSLNCI